jgi:alcohol dehydrogenase, propanol-preferring
MRAARLHGIKQPLILEEIPIPNTSDDQVLIRVHACAICRTDLHIIEGDLANPKLPLILGHQIVGEIEKVGKNVKHFKVKDLVGVPWLGKTCGTCSYCTTHRENLCDFALFTGYTLDGGFAEYCNAFADYIFPLAFEKDDLHVAPLLCSGMIGYRALKMVGDAKKIGFYGFGSSAHLLIQVANYQGKEIFAFTRKGDLEGQNFARKMGAKWSGDSETIFPNLLDAAIIFAPIGELMVQALRSLRKGGIVVSAGIHMSDIPAFPYDLLWGERSMRSIANLTRDDGNEFLHLASQVNIQSEITLYQLADINQAFDDLKKGRLNGTAVITL